jgi:hypothetical protein
LLKYLKLYVSPNNVNQQSSDDAGCDPIKEQIDATAPRGRQSVRRSWVRDRGKLNIAVHDSTKPGLGSCALAFEFYIASAGI